MLKNSRKMKGDYEFVTTPLGILIFVAAILGLMLFVWAHAISVSADMKTLSEEIQAVDAAHIVKDCFTGADGRIQASYLESRRGSSICSFCGCSGDIGARVEYLEGGLVKGGPNKGDSYDFGYDKGGKYKHRIFITVSDGGKEYVSSLMVSVND
jgi:hypothetical protein